MVFVSKQLHSELRAVEVVGCIRLACRLRDVMSAIRLDDLRNRHGRTCLSSADGFADGPADGSTDGSTDDLMGDLLAILELRSGQDLHESMFNVK
jgi:hypothetical protein